MDLLDNSQLEELMKIDVSTATAGEKNLFLEKFRDSQLIMPVEYSSNVFEAVENAEVGDVFEAEGETGFSINYITDDDGNNAVPLFTSEEMMKKAGIESSSYVLFMSDLADLMKQAGDKYAMIAVNPFTDLNINIDMDSFLYLFDGFSAMSNTFREVLKLIRENSIELEDNVSVMLHTDEDFMNEMAEDGVYQTQMPMNLNSDPHFNEDLKYTYVLLFDKSRKLLYLGDDFEGDFDIIVAPASEFEFVENLDDNTSVWKCTAQPFFEG